MIRYRLEFVGPSELTWPPENVFRDDPIIAGTVEMYAGERYIVESVDETENPPVVVLRKLLV